MRILPYPVKPLIVAGFATITSSLFALDGANNVFVTVPTGTTLGWKTFEIISGNDTLGGLALNGFVWTSRHDDWDGVGAYKSDDSTLRVFINHEAGSGSTFSRVDLNLPNLQSWVTAGIANNNNSNQVAATGQIVTAVSLGWTSIGSGTGALNNPCSANVWAADTFGPGRGFEDTLYLLGEESVGGRFWVMDVATRILYEAPDLGTSKWENATIVDTGRTDTVAIFLSADTGASSIGTAPLRLYIGLKNPSGGFLARNGLIGGKVYHWDPDGSSTNGTLGGIFSGGNGSAVNGTWVLSSTNAALFSKLEDVHTNENPNSPTYGMEVAIASQANAVFTMDLSVVDFVSGDLGTNRDASVLVLFAAGTQSSSNNFAGMDNLVWSPDGNIYVNEDDGEGDIWKIAVDSLKASYAVNDFTPDGTQVYDILDADYVGESSGIIDISFELGYEPGSIFLTVGQSSTLSTNQLAMLVSPSATLLPIPLTFASWISGYPSLTDSDALTTADPEKDGASNLLEYAFNLDPTLKDAGPVIADSGTAGLPRITIQTVGPLTYLGLEYIRRINTTDLSISPEFSSMLITWESGAEITSTPVDSYFERVVVRDIIDLSIAPTRFGHLTVELVTP